MMKKALHIVQTLTNHGHSAFLVGGCVRDLLLNREPKDYDITTAATPPQIQEIFPHTVAVGEQFGVIKVNVGGDLIDVATYRSETDYSDGRRPDTVRYETDPREDVLRRDFTVNGLLMGADRQVVDYVGGLEDLKRKVIRAIGDPIHRFEEDSLRILRAVRFVCQLGFTVDSPTSLAACLLVPLLPRISMERIRDEFQKILESPEPELGLSMLKAIGALQHIIPELLDLDGVTQPAKYHRYNVGEHVRQMMVHARKPLTFELALAILLHDIAKPRCAGLKPDGTIHFHNHEHVGKEMAITICDRLKLSADQRFLVGEFVHKHMRPHTALEMKTSTLKRLCRIPRFDEFLELHRLDCLCSNGNMETYDFLSKFYDDHKHEVAVTPLITGHDLLALGVKPGPIYKTVLTEVETQQLDGTLKTKEEAMEVVKKLVCV